MIKLPEINVKLAVGIGAAILVVSLLLGTWLVIRNANARAEEYRDHLEQSRFEAVELSRRLEAEQAENERLREVLKRAYEAVERADKAIQEATERYAEQIEKIDDVDPDWLLCPLPDGVREALGSR